MDAFGASDTVGVSSAGTVPDQCLHESDDRLTVPIALDGMLLDRMSDRISDTISDRVS